MLLPAVAGQAQEAETPNPPPPETDGLTQVPGAEEVADDVVSDPFKQAELPATRTGDTTTYYPSVRPEGGGAQSSSTEEVQSANPAGCTVSVTNPYKANGAINGHATQSCAVQVSQYLDAYLEQYRGAGWWRDKDDAHPSGFGYALDANLKWLCAGTNSGEQKYRVRATGGYYYAGTVYQSAGVVSSTRTITCN